MVSSDGLLYQLRQCNIPQEKINTIILDFILAAGDTVSIKENHFLYLKLFSGGKNIRISDLRKFSFFTSILSPHFISC